MATYNINYVFRLVDQFSAGAIGVAAAMGRVTAASRRMGGALAGAAAAGGVVAMFSSAVKAAGSWENAMANVRRTASLSRKEMEEYGKDALDLSVKLATPVEKIAETMTRVAQTGIRDRKALMAFTELAAKAAIVWDDISPDVAASALGKFADIWFGDKGIDAMIKGVTDLGDAINELSNRSNFKAPELLKFFDRTNQRMKSFGFSPEYTAAFGGAALATGVQSGQLQGTRADMTLRGISRLIGTRPTKRQKYALGRLKVKGETLRKEFADDPEAAFLNLLGRINRYRPYGPWAQNANTQAQVDLANNLLGSRQGEMIQRLAGNENELKRALTIVSDKWARRFLGLEPGFNRDERFLNYLKNSGKYKDMYKDLEMYGKIIGRVGSMEEEFQRRSDTLRFATKMREAAWNKLKVTLGAPMLQPLAGVERWLAGTINDIANAVRKNPTFGQAIGAALSGAIMAGLMYGVTSGVGATGSLGTRIMTGLIMGGVAFGGTLVITALLVGAGAFLINNWKEITAYINQPHTFKIHFPDAPPWVAALLDPTKVSSLANAISRIKIALGFGSDSDKKAVEAADVTHWALGAARAWDREHRNKNPRIGSAPGSTPSLEAPLERMARIRFERGQRFGWMRGTWSDFEARSGLLGYGPPTAETRAGQIPQSMVISFDPVNFKAATINVTGTVDASSLRAAIQGSGTLQAEPTAGRGTAAPSVGGGAGGFAPGSALTP